MAISSNTRSKILILFSLLIMLTACLTQNDIDSCCGDNDKLDDLRGIWYTDKVFHEGEDYTAYWGDFVITISVDKKFETQGSIDFVVWPENGTFEITTASGAGMDVINRSDGALIYIDKLNDKVLDLSMDLGANGRWEFYLIK